MTLFDEAEKKFGKFPSVEEIDKTEASAGPSSFMPWVSLPYYMREQLRGAGESLSEAKRKYEAGSYPAAAAYGLLGGAQGLFSPATALTSTVTGPASYYSGIPKPFLDVPADLYTGGLELKLAGKALPYAARALGYGGREAPALTPPPAAGAGAALDPLLQTMRQERAPGAPVPPPSSIMGRRADPRATEPFWPGRVGAPEPFPGASPPPTPRPVEPRAARARDIRAEREPGKADSRESKRIENLKTAADEAQANARLAELQVKAAQASLSKAEEGGKAASIVRFTKALRKAETAWEAAKGQAERATKIAGLATQRAARGAARTAPAAPAAPRPAWQAPGLPGRDVPAATWADYAQEPLPLRFGEELGEPYGPSQTAGLLTDQRPRWQQPQQPEVGAYLMLSERGPWPGVPTFYNPTGQALGGRTRQPAGPAWWEQQPMTAGERRLEPGPVESAFEEAKLKGQRYESISTLPRQRPSRAKEPTPALPRTKEAKMAALEQIPGRVTPSEQAALRPPLEQQVQQNLMQPTAPTRSERYKMIQKETARRAKVGTEKPELKGGALKDISAFKPNQHVMFTSPISKQSKPGIIKHIDTRARTATVTFASGDRTVALRMLTPIE